MESVSGLSKVSGLSDDELADGICSWAGRVAAGMAQLLALVAEFDRREAWAGPGMLSCAHWLSWQAALSPGTAREWVRVARQLTELPAVRTAFEAGRMSWSQARAITRVAEPDDGVDWVELARHGSADQLERIVRGIRRTKHAEAVQADPEETAYRMRTRHRYDADGNLVVTIYAPAEDAPVILAGLAAQRAELDRQREARAAAAAAVREDVPAGTSEEAPIAADRVPAPDPEQVPVLRDVPAGTPGPPVADPIAPESSRATDGDALLDLACAALDSQRTAHPEIARRTRAHLVVQVDPLSGWARLRDGELLPPTSLKAVLKTLPGRGGILRLRRLTAADLTAHDLGRSTREPSLALRELLGSLDGERCRFPGCTRHTKLHAHHVVYWADDGPTDLSNLLLLCSRHHTLVHQLGFHLVLRPDRRLEVHTPDGIPVLRHPGQPWADPTQLDPTGRISAGTLPPTHCDARLDLGYAVAVLLQQAA